MANLYSSAASNSSQSIFDRLTFDDPEDLSFLRQSLFRQVLPCSLFRRIQRSPRTRVSSRMLMHADDRTRRESCCPEKTRASHRQAGRRRCSIIDSVVANRSTEKLKDTQQAHFLLPVAHHAHAREIGGFLETLLDQAKREQLATCRGNWGYVFSREYRNSMGI